LLNSKLNVKCPQLSKPKANGDKGEERRKRQQWQGTKTPSGDRMEKKTLGEPRLSQGASPPLANERTVYDYELGSIMSGVRCDQNFHDIYPVHLVGVGSSGR